MAKNFQKPGKWTGNITNISLLFKTSARDYSYNPSVSENKATEALSRAAEFLQAAKEYLGNE